MKFKSTFILFGVASVILLSLMSFDTVKDTQSKGCHVFGKVKFVEYGEDYKVKFVDYGEDLKIKYVDYGEDKAGCWKAVEYGEKFKLKIVEYGEDIKVKEVTYGEGCQ